MLVIGVLAMAAGISIEEPTAVMGEKMVLARSRCTKL